MHVLPLDWSAVLDNLSHPTDASRGVDLDRFKTRMDAFFLFMHYEDGEVIMPQGSFGSFAGLLLSGTVSVTHRPLARQGSTTLGSLARPAECWNRSWLAHWLERAILDRTDRLPADAPTPHPGERVLRWFARRVRPLLAGLEHHVSGLTPSPAGSSAWRRPWHTLMNAGFGWLGRRAGERALTKPSGAAGDTGGQELIAVSAHNNKVLRPSLERLLGVASALWNTPRDVTLTARGTCELIMVRREVLRTLFEKSNAFQYRFENDFLTRNLPTLLLDSRLFRSTFSDGDIVNWDRLCIQLRKAVRGTGSAAARRVVQTASAEFRRLFTGKDPHRADVLRELNKLLRTRELHHPQSWPIAELSEEARSLLDRSTHRSENETIRLNRLLVEAAFAGQFHSDAAQPLTIEETTSLVTDLIQSGNITLTHYSEGKTLAVQGEDAAHLSIIISGNVSVWKQDPGQSSPILVNQFDRNGFLGVESLDPLGKYPGTVRAETETNLVMLNRTAVHYLVTRRPELHVKMANEAQRVQIRDLRLSRQELVPPRDPPQELASKLMLGTNLLRIDMDLCTRCDLCVKACATAHDGIPRFQRSNPDLHFGKWTIAAACVHCSDAPCQDACPVGAIGFLENGAVQIHLHRCIGCDKCVPACPFDVIHMEPPALRRDQIASKGLVATKCDLCLTDRRDPPCVTSCPYGAAMRGPPRVLFPEIKSWALPMVPS